MSTPRVVVVGAGIGGLTAAASLAKAGLDVAVLEAHVDPGGCASTYFHQGYQFDAGATLAGGFYPGGPMALAAAAAGVPAWPVEPVDAAISVHLPGREPIVRWSDGRRWSEHERAFGPAGHRFWQWQERTADALWALALQNPHWPPQSLADVAALARIGLGWLFQDPAARFDPRLALDAFQPAAVHLRGQSPALRLFVDGQLLIAAQATAAHANALYAAAALDLPRRGVVEVRGGIGALADTLVTAVRAHSGAVHFRHEATQVTRAAGGGWQVHTRRDASFHADQVILNLPPWNIRTLLGDAAPASLVRRTAQPVQGWGAFVLYLGVEGHALPAAGPLHHQVIHAEPLGEGNSVFISLSAATDAGRAPAGMRALTLSTHTALDPWWQLETHDRAAYEARRDAYTERLLDAAKRVFPGLRIAVKLALPGTPVTFQRFTRRERGWVGGFPQTNLFRAWGPRLGPRLWMVGDSIFPGQSVAAVALGGLRVAGSVAQELAASG